MKGLIESFSDTLDIFAFRVGSASRGVKLLMLGGTLLIAMTVLSLTRIGQSIRIVASGSSNLIVPGTDDTYTSVVLGYLRTFTVNDSIYAVSGVFVALLGSLILIPLSGYSYAGIVPAGDLVTIKRTDYHLVTDSIALQFISFVSLIQVAFLTFLSAILTLAAQHPGRGIVAGWGIWCLIVLLTSATAWLFEYMHRRFGAWSKYALAAAAVAVAGVLVLVAPTASFELFGISPAYTRFIAWLDAAPPVALLLPLGIFLATGYLLLQLTRAIGNRTIALQDPQRDRYRGPGRLNLSNRRGSMSQLHFLLNLVVHQRNIFRPLVFAVISINVSLILVGGNAGILYGLPAIIPLIVSLSWGVNTFGIIGGGTAWLVSQPRSKQTILYSIAGVQLLMIATIAAVTVVLEIVLYKISIDALMTFLLTTAAVAAYMTRSSIEKAVKGPERYKVHVRGEQVLPPGKALGYIVRFFVGSALIIGLVMLAPNIWLQLGVCGVIVAWSYMRLRLLSVRWTEDPEIVQHIISTVGY